MLVGVFVVLDDTGHVDANAPIEGGHALVHQPGKFPAGFGMERIKVGRAGKATPERLKIQLGSAPFVSRNRNDGKPTTRPIDEVGERVGIVV